MNGKKVFIATSVFILILMPLLSMQYGQTGDEWIQMEYGRDIWSYFLNGDRQALNYDTKGLEYQKMQYYSGTYDFVVEGLHRIFSFVPILYLRHFINALLGTVMMIFTGMLAARISKNWYTGLFALLFIFLSPRIFGESMNNPKDIPFACGFIVCIYGLVTFLQQYPYHSRVNAFWIFCGFALAFATRSSGAFLLIPVIIIYTLVHFRHNKQAKAMIAGDRKHTNRVFFLLSGALLIGYCVGLAGWPWALQSPISRPLLALQEMTNRTIFIKVLFEGEYVSSASLPWYYELKWILISTPVIILALVAMFFVLPGKNLKNYSPLQLSVIVFCALFPLLYIIYKKSNVYDTWRHVFFVYPFWVVLASLAVQTLQQLFASKQLKTAVMGIVLLALIPAVYWMIRSHPNQYVYFNELTGGLENAHGYFETDYYQNTSKQAADWVRSNARKKPGQKVIVMSNMTGLENYFTEDTSWLSYKQGNYQERHFLDYDYFIGNSRYIPTEQLQNNKWPAQNAVHNIEVDGVPLCTILEKRDRSGILAYQAFQRKDYATAERLYAQYLATDSLDEYAYVNSAIALANLNNTDAALKQINKAIELTPLNATYYDVLAAIYEVRGNFAAMQDAINRANALKQEAAEGS